jgi:O-antigen/teichoic acid export membrane protein
MLGKLADMVTGLNSELISISRHYKFNFRISVLLLVMIIFFNRLLIPEYGIYGVATGVTAALVIFNLLKFMFLWYKMQLHPFSKNTLLVLFCGAITLVIGYYIPRIINPYLDTVVRSFAIIISYILLLIWLRPSIDLRNYLLSVKSNKRLF